VSFKEQIMSKDKNPSVFSCQMETNVFHILQIFFTTHMVLKIEEYRLDTPQFLHEVYNTGVMMKEISLLRKLATCT